MSKMPTCIGSVISLALIILLVSYSIQEFAIMFALANTEFTTYDFNQDQSLQGTVSFGKFNDSANFIFGIVDETFNLLDNPYIQVHAYLMQEDLKLRRNSPVGLRKCTIEDLTAFMPKETTAYYPNSLCFQDRDKVQLRGNWFDKKYQVVHLAVEECNG